MTLRLLGQAGFILAAFVAACYMAGAFAHATWILVEVGWGVL